jgi:hypothetical protein
MPDPLHGWSPHPADSSPGRQPGGREPANWLPGIGRGVQLGGIHGSLAASLPAASAWRAGCLSRWLRVLARALPVATSKGAVPAGQVAAVVRRLGVADRGAREQPGQVDG